MKEGYQADTNYCTLFPDGSWGYCCYQHDCFYDLGGQESDRLAADITLRR